MGKFKQGDRVKALVNGIDYKVGDEFVLTADGDGKSVYFDDNAGDDRIRPQEEFELLPVPDKKPPFKVGDRVRLLTNNNGFGAVGALGTAKRINCGDEDCLVHFDDEFLGDRQWYAKWCNLELVATLQIEAGKYYRTREGRKVGPMVEFFSDRYRECDGDGRWWDKYGVGHMYAKGDDLIAEWVDEPVGQANEKASLLPVTLKLSDGSLTMVVSEFKMPTIKSPSIVAHIDDGQPMPAARPLVHDTKEDAEKEAKRLSEKHRGKEFGVFTLISKHQTEVVYDLEWQRLAANGNKIGAIKAIRELTGFGLKAAKDGLEDWLSRNAA